MFPLYTKVFPASAAELSALLNASIQKGFAKAAQPVAIRDESYPQLAEISITLDGAELRSDAPRPPRASGAGKAGLQVRELQVTADDMRLGPALGSIRLRARDVVLNQATDAKGDLLLVLQSATEGRVEVSALKAEIENAIATVAKQEAGKHGVAIDGVQLTVRLRGESGVDAEVQLRAKKLFFTTNLKIAAQLDLDAQLNATLAGLACQADGAIGALACGALQPHLQKLEGRSFALLALPLGEVRLREMRLATGETLSVTADFGA
ncbi:MAG: hypothetical protein ABI883_01780 [Chthoniobacterales bacterium]